MTQDPALDQPYVIDLHAEPPQTFRLTTRPSPLDVRDYLSALAPPVTFDPAFVLPACADPFDQSQLGACTTNGMAGMYKTELLLAGRPAVDISRLALYYAERFAEGSVGEDAGATPRDGLTKMQTDGVGREELWPYDIGRFTESPPQAEIDDEKNQRIRAFYRISGITGAKTALHNLHPVGLAMLVFGEMQRTRNGVIPMPVNGEGPEGGHFVYLRGWQDRDDWPGGGYFIIRNSWGVAAGNGHGDYLLPYQYAGNTQMVSEYWYIELP